VSRSGVGGWLALGFPTTAGMMTPAEAFVASSDGGVGAWHLGGYQVGDITPHGSGAMPVQHSNISTGIEGGVLVLRLGNVVIADTGSVNLLFARHGSGAFPSYHGHGPSSRLGFTVNMLTGGVVAEAPTGPDSVRAHGVLQLLAWIFLAPIGILIKRLGTRSPRLKGMKVAGLPVAFVAHAAMMGVAVLFCLGAVVLALADFPGTGRAKYGHGTIGLIVCACACVQPFPALLCRPDPEKDPARRRIFNLGHRGLGMFTLLLAIVCTFLGICNYEQLWDASEAKVFYLTAVAGIVGSLALFCGLDFLRPRRDNKATPGMTSI